MKAKRTTKEELLLESEELRRENAALKEELALEKSLKRQSDQLTWRSVAFHIENAPLGIIEWGPEMQIQRWTGNAEAIFGWKAEEVIGKRLDEWEFVYDDDVDFVRGVVEDRLLNGREEKIRVTNRNYRKDGAVIWCEWIGSVLRHEKGYVESILTFVQDITLQKRAQEELAEKEKLFRTIVEALNEGLMIFDENRVIIYLNPRFTEITGLSLEDLVGETNAEDLAFGNRRHIADHHYNLVKRGQSVLYEITMTDRLGEKLPVLLSGRPVLDEEGVFQGHIVAITDLTDVKRSKEKLRKSEELLRVVFQAAEDHIFVKDASLRYTHVNASMAGALGLKPSAILGLRTEDLFDREAADHIRNRDLRVLLGESVEETHARTMGDELRTFHDVTVPLYNVDRDVEAICGISRDVTHLRPSRPASTSQSDEYPSHAMRETLIRADYAATTEITVLLQGESGTGKDFLAKWIHERSKRSKNTFFSVNCAALPRELAESELFGHEAGAFSGAAGRKKGLLELAEGGTLLLNEIGELDLALQSKLLTFFDTKSFMRVGGEQPVRIDCRIMAASHRDLEKAVEDGIFLGPLYYRINVFVLRVPPLRDRLEDIPLLVEDLLNQLASDLQLQHVPLFDDQYLESLSQYHWPGNIRELRNVLERSLIAPGMERLGPPDKSVVPSIQPEGEMVRVNPDRVLREVLDEVTGLMFQRALEKTSGNKNEAARFLGLSRTAFYRRLAQLSLDTAERQPS